MMVDEAREPRLVDLAADEEDRDGEAAGSERRVDQEGVRMPSARVPAVTTSAVLRPRPIEPPATWNR